MVRDGTDSRRSKQEKNESVKSGVRRNLTLKNLRVLALPASSDREERVWGWEVGRKKKREWRRRRKRKRKRRGK